MQGVIQAVLYPSLEIAKVDKGFNWEGYTLVPRVAEKQKDFFFEIPKFNLRTSTICCYQQVDSTRLKRNKYAFASPSSLGVVEENNSNNNSCNSSSNNNSNSSNNNSNNNSNSCNNNSNNDSNNSNKVYSGLVTLGSKKRIKTAVELMLLGSKKELVYNPVLKKTVDFHIAFVTLTLSINDYFIGGTDAYNLLLKPFLQWLTITVGCKSYIWKAERQSRFDKKGILKESHGQLHYHLIINKFLVHTDIKEKWNYLQRKNNLLETFKRKYGHDNPNSIDIHSIYKVDDVANYLCKYISKEGAESVIENEDGTQTKLTVEGKVWDCSKNLKGKRLPTFEINEHNWIMLNNMVTDSVVHKISLEKCDVYKFGKFAPINILTDAQLIEYDTYIKDLAV